MDPFTITLDSDIDGAIYVVNSGASWGIRSLAEIALWGQSERGGGLPGGTGTGVLGTSPGGMGVQGTSQSGIGVQGTSTSADGVQGISTSADGVNGNSADSGHSGVSGFNSAAGQGVWGGSAHGIGVKGISTSADGVNGNSADSGHSGVSGFNSAAGQGVWGGSAHGIGVKGISTSADGVNGNSADSGHSGVSGFNSAAGQGVWGGSAQGIGVFCTSASSTSYGLFAENTAGGVAAYIQGNVTVTGDIILKNADCAEDFTVSEYAAAEPGTVMVIGEGGVLSPSGAAYDKRVAGVVSGAGDFKPGMILDRHGASDHRRPVALMGKVYCKADARLAPIEVGDLLTTSETPGHAMKVGDPLRAFGSVIGKALRPLSDGVGLVPILISLQ